jgi:uncharacterized lipoprotein NlpE involved in copper resistance
MSSPTQRVLSALLIAVFALSVAACSRDGDAPSGHTGRDEAAEGGLAPLAESFDGAWSGVLPCADCDGIDVELELQREAGAAGRYRLVETYLGVVDAAGFEIAGEWRETPCRVGDADGLCVMLAESGQRWFRHPDGSLQAVDADGRALDPDGARLQRR